MLSILSNCLFNFTLILTSIHWTRSIRVLSHYHLPLSCELTVSRPSYLLRYIVRAIKSCLIAVSTQSSSSSIVNTYALIDSTAHLGNVRSLHIHNVPYHPTYSVGTQNVFQRKKYIEYLLYKGHLFSLLLKKANKLGVLKINK